MRVEKKLLEVGAIELKFDAELGILEGYASVFNGLDSYGDSILPGAYTKTLKKRDRAVKMRWNHFGPVIGKWLEMRQDEKGLYVRGELTPGHSVAQDVLASLKHGAIDGLSIGFYPSKYTEDDEGKRTLKEIDLVEISVVEEPADLAARVTSVKADIEQAETIRDVELILRDVGFTKSSAGALVSRVKSLSLGDLKSKSFLAEVAEKIQQTTLSK